MERRIVEVQGTLPVRVQARGRRRVAVVRRVKVKLEVK